MEPLITVCPDVFKLLQVNEIHARMAVLNKFTELGRPHTQVVS